MSGDALAICQAAYRAGVQLRVEGKRLAEGPFPRQHYAYGFMVDGYMDKAWGIGETDRTLFSSCVAPGAVYSPPGRRTEVSCESAS